MKCFLSYINDFNGDGKADVLHGSNSPQYNGLYLSNGDQENPASPDLLIKVSNNLGGEININYIPAPQVLGAIVPADKTYPNIANSSPCPLTTEITYDDGMELATSKTKYAYTFYNGTIHTGFPNVQANLGFDWIEKTDENTGSSVRTYYYKDLTNLLDFRLLVKKEETYGPNHVLYLEKDYMYNSHMTVDNHNSSNPQIPSAKFIYKTDEYAKNYNGESGNPITYHITYGYDDYGNRIRKTDEGDISVATDDVEYDATYDYNSNNNLSLLRSEQTRGYLLSGQQGLVADTSYNYNTNFLLESKVMKNGAQNITTSFGYDNYGNITSVTDGRGNTTTLQYDPNFQTYIRFKTNLKSQTEETQYDNWMNPINTIDVNGVIWQATYDVFSRPKTTIAPGDDTANPTKRITDPDELTDNNGSRLFPNCQRTEKKIGNNNYFEIDSYYDGLERLIQKKTEAKNGWITIDYTYDSSGRLSKTSVPYFTTASAYSTPDTAVKTTWLEYDPINRVKASHNPDGTVIQTVYGKQETKTLDENGHMTNKMIVGNTQYDIKYVGVYPGQTEYSRTTKTIYGDGIKTIDATGTNVFIDQVDMLDRKISSVNPISGTWSYTYDDNNNNPISQTDAKNQTIIIHYDELNRPTEKIYPDNSRVSFYYDEDGYGYSKGRLTRMVYPGGQINYTYDAKGLYTAITQIINGVTRTKNLTYNALDHIATETYPDGEVITYNYDRGGKVAGLSGNSSYISNIDYTQLGKLSNITYGNGIQTSYEYYDTLAKYDNTAGTYFSYLLKQIATTKTGANLLNIGYQYDKQGNVKVKQETSAITVAEYYGYDEMNRLTSANSTSYGLKTYSYDLIDNITVKDGQIFQYDSVVPYRLINDGRYSYTYDANGNMTGRSDGRVIGYDNENLVTTVGGNHSYAYDPTGQRTIQTNAGKTTLYFFNDYEEEYQSGTRTKTTKYYLVNGQRLAQSSNTDGIRYNHMDHLGSIRFSTDTNGNILRKMDYDPYGQLLPTYMDSFDSSLGSWTVNSSHGAQFILSSGLLNIFQTTTQYSGDSIIKRFDDLKEINIDFDVKMSSSVDNDGCSLGIETNGLRMVFYREKLYYYNNGWILVGSVTLDQLTHIQMVLHTNRIEIKIGGELKYSLNGTFPSKNYLAFRDYGLCFGVITNCIDNLTITQNFDDYCFTGKKNDSDIGWIYFGARYYDPEVGRFVSVDPVKDGANWFEYCKSNPINAVDTDGRITFFLNGIGNPQKDGTPPNYAQKLVSDLRFSDTTFIAIPTFQNQGNLVKDLSACFGMKTLLDTGQAEKAYGKVLDVLKNYKFASEETINFVGYSGGAIISDYIIDYLHWDPRYSDRIDNFVNIGDGRFQGPNEFAKGNYLIYGSNDWLVGGSDFGLTAGNYLGHSGFDVIYEIDGATHPLPWEQNGYWSDTFYDSIANLLDVKRFVQ